MLGEHSRFGHRIENARQLAPRLLHVEVGLCDRQQRIVAGRLLVRLPGTQLLAGRQGTENGIRHAKIECRPATAVERAEARKLNVAICRLRGAIVMGIVDAVVHVGQPQSSGPLELGRRLLHARLRKSDHQGAGLRQTDRRCQINRQRVVRFVRARCPQRRRLRVLKKLGANEHRLHLHAVVFGPCA